MATFGKTTIGKYRHSLYIDNTKHACRFIAPEDGVITAVTCYGSRGETENPEVFYLGVYSDRDGAPDTLLGYGGPVSFPYYPEFAWVTVSGLNIPIKANTPYWLFVLIGANSLNYAYDEGEPNQFIAQGHYADPPPPDEKFGEGTYYARAMSIYATYTPTAPKPLTVYVTPESADLYLGQQQVFKANISGGVEPYSVRWLDAAGNVIGTGDTYIFTATSVGTFEIYAEVTDSQGTVATSNIVTITVKEVLPVLFDNCDQVNGWEVFNNKLPPHVGDNTIVVDTIDKVEGAGSLKMTFGATGTNWGGYFVKKGLWDVRKNPVMRMMFKAHKTLPSDFTFAIRTPDNWSGYNILDKITTIGEWLTIYIDLRLPDRGEMFPDLSRLAWVEFSSWQFIGEPTAFSIDSIELVEGPVIPLDARIKPESVWTVIGSSVTFKVDVKGGVEPYSYRWYVNNVEKPETSSTFTFTPTEEGDYQIMCIVTDSTGSSINVFASLTAAYVPPQPPSPPSKDVFKSEIRAVFIDNWLYRNPDWQKMAETCRYYGVNTIIIGVSPTEIYDFTAKKPKYNDLLARAVQTFHSYGFNVHILANICFYSFAEWNAVLSDGSTTNWLCLTKKATRQAWFAMIESLVRNYNIEGFMFDYIRWRGTYMCFCTECKEKFINDTGLSDVNWPTDCLEGGRYYWQFIQWRLNPITEFVRDAVQLMRSIKPGILVSAAVFTAFSNCGNYWVMSIGQHTADWVDKGYLDFVSPMMYTTSASTVVGYLVDSLNFYTGGSEGKIPMVPFITNVDMSIDEYTPMPVENFVEIVRQLKLNGADGYIIWRYGGPGFEQDPFRKFADIRPHLAGLINAGLMEPVWAIQNLSVKVNETSATISWDTTVPTASKIEYGEALFKGTVRYGDFGRPIYYKDVDYIGGTIIEDTTFKSSHSFTIPKTETTQFRIQSIDEKGVKVTTSPMPAIEIVPPPPPPPPPPLPPTTGPLGLWRFPIITWILEFIRRWRTIRRGVKE